jgi:hypothetical protein
MNRMLGWRSRCSSSITVLFQVAEIAAIVVNEAQNCNENGASSIVWKVQDHPW